MDEDVYEIPVHYRGEEVLVPAQLIVSGYTHKFRVELGGHEVFFEPDEERNYRAMLDPDHRDSAKIDVAFLQAIAAGIEAAVK
jgi:hypothetical protein